MNRDALKYLQDNPDFFLTESVGITSIENYQKTILRAIVENERVAIAACHNVGKSWTLARAVIWFMSCFPGAKVITTAPTYNQVKNILWSEIRSAHAQSKIPLGGSLNLTEWRIDADHFAIGFTPKNEVSSEMGQGTQSSFQGFHANYLLVIFDEATGIPHNIWTMAEGLMTSGYVRFVAIANPTSKNSEFFKCFQSKDWKKIHLSCLDSPNFAANNILTMDDLKKQVSIIKALDDVDRESYLKTFRTPKQYMLTVSWCLRMILKWGWDHPLTLSKILGQFPEDADNALIQLGMVERAQLRVYEPKPSDRKLLGVDVARFGSDSTVMTALHGYKYLYKKSYQKKDLAEQTGIVIHEIITNNFDVVVIDETGVGGGLVDNLKAAQAENRLPRSVEIRGVQFGAGVNCNNGDHCEHKDCDKARFVNKKARMFVLLAEDLKENLCLSDDAIYLEELVNVLYKYDTKGRTYIESKDEYKKRTGRDSPDSADSLALANYGRYDEIKVMSFDSRYTSDFMPTMAGSINRGNEW